MPPGGPDAPPWRRVSIIFAYSQDAYSSGRRAHQEEGHVHDLSDVGRYYRDYVDVMAHWDKALPGFSGATLNRGLVR